ncbi:uncharacterized protein [Ptychodera flava]|uniref:uncharacterized protein n=1 Tax=Ptychodera flava TaxID=63121 RepID=UPI00396A4831
MKTSERIISLITVIFITWTEVSSVQELPLITEDSFVITGPESLTFSPYYYTDFTFSINLYRQSGGDGDYALSQIYFFFSNDTDFAGAYIASGYALSVGQSPEPTPITPEGVDISNWTVSMRPDMSYCQYYNYICIYPDGDISCFDATYMIDCDSTVNPDTTTEVPGTGCDGGNAVSAAGLTVAMVTLLASYIVGQK